MKQNSEGERGCQDVDVQREREGQRVRERERERLLYRENGRQKRKEVEWEDE